MRIIVNDIAASEGGALTILNEFYSCVRENGGDHEWIFLLGDRYVEETENIKVITLPEIKGSRLKKLKFDLFSGKKYIEELNPDAVFSLQNTITFGVSAPQTVYIHQSIPFQSVKKFSFLNGSERGLAVYQYLIGSIIKLSAKKADKIIVQTEWIRDAVCKKCGIKGEKTVVVMPNLKDVSSFVDKTLFDSKNFFYPTSAAIYKNVSCIAAACEILDAKGLDYKTTLTVDGNPNYSKNIECIGRIPYTEVLSRYNRGVLVFPSYIESFGYPLAEARAMGTVVFASDCPFSREVLADYENAYFFDPFKPEELAALMEDSICGRIERKNTEQTARATQDSWLKVLSEIIQGEKI